MTADVVEIKQTPGRSREPVNDWRENLARRGDRFTGDERNLLIALRIAPELTNLVRFNDFLNRAEFGRIPPWRQAKLGDPWTDDDDLQLQVWLQQHEIDIRLRQSLGDCVAVAAKDWPVHPVRAYLRGLKWDGEPRLQLWLSEYLNAQGPPDYLAAIGTKFLISTVARVETPGCQVDHVLTLEGPQGVGKTQTVKILGGEWTTDGLPDLHSKDAAIHLQGVWIVEIAELAAMRRTETEAVKAFLSRRDDRFRPPYARRSVDVPRQCVFVGTTNEAVYLRDPTGNRRFWPVRCGASIDLVELERARDQLWAEAEHRFQQGESWHLNEQESKLAAIEQEQRQLATELEQRVAEYLDSLTTDEVTTGEVFANALGVDTSTDVERAVRLGRQLAEAMQRAGWMKVGVSGRGKARRTVYRRTEIHRDKTPTYATRARVRTDGVSPV